MQDFSAITENVDMHVLLSIIHDLPNYVFYKDTSLRYQACNKNFATYIGCKSTNDVIGKSDFELPWAHSQARLYRAEDRQIINTARPILSKEVTVTVAGQEKILWVSKAPLFSSEKVVIGVLCIYIDISDKKQAELALLELNQQLETALKTKSEFIANMSHDFRTPISGMLGMIHSLIDAAQTAQVSINQAESQADFKQAMTSFEVLTKRIMQDGNLLLGATNELLQICNEVLELTQLDAKQSEQNNQSFAVTDFIDHNKILFQPTAKQKELTLSYTIVPTVPQYLRGNRVYLDRVLLNLVSNGLKFTETGNVTVTLDCLTVSDPVLPQATTVQLKIQVTDTGIGIPSDQYDKIFEHFSRLAPAYEGKYPGAGLGLYTAKRYIEAMNGSIDVTSTVGVGSCFTVLVPLNTADHSDHIHQSITLPAITSSNSDQDKTSPLILIVEDNALAAVAVKLALKSIACATEVAQNGQQALDLVEKQPYDLILMDIGLPDFSGIVVTKMLRAKAVNTPIIALTGHADDNHMRTAAMKAGMQDVTSKPVKAVILQQLLKKYLHC